MNSAPTHEYGQFDSWKTIDEITAIKKCDKSFFENRGFVIPKGVSWFFEADNMANGSRKDIELLYNGTLYDAYIQKEQSELGRFRVFWANDLISAFSEKNPQVGEDYPEATFKKIEPGKYKVYFGTDDPDNSAKKYTVNQSVWIAAALLSFEVYENNPAAPLSDYYFKQSRIVHRAQPMTEKNVDGARCSLWCCAGKEKNANNYLSGDLPGELSPRRLSGFHEYPEKTHPEDLDMDDILSANGREITMQELFNFVENKYPGSLQQKTEISYIGILKYLELNREMPYSNPENISNPQNKEHFMEMKEKGSNTVYELQKIAALCSEKFGLEQLADIQWLDGSKTKTRKSLLVKLREKGIASPATITIVVEMRKPTEASYRITLDISDGMDKETMARYHSHLDLPLTPGLNYYAGSNAQGCPEQLTESQDVIRDKVSSGELRKVQICAVVNQIESQTNEYFEQAILKSVEQLLPYYNHVIGKENSPVTDPPIDPPITTMNEFDKNTILYGPPGTGKTYSTAIYAVAICDDMSIAEARSFSYADIMSRYRELQEEGRVAFTTFHQSYGYEEFIEGIKPVLQKNVVEAASTDIGYNVVDGVFKSFCRKANSTEVPVPHVFVIDEINRGNISKIFGELITLIEDTKRDGLPESIPAVLPYSNEEFAVPQNVYLLGTMNTADRSIALMDTALRRRFRFVEMMPDANVLRAIGADRVEDLDVAAMLEKINERITFLYDREHTIGHAFFTRLKDAPTIETLSVIFRKSIVPLLQEYFYEDYQKIQLVLGDNGKSDPSHKFILDEDVKVKSVFKGSPEDVVDLPEKKYTINAEAFTNIESYKEIF